MMQSGVSLSRCTQSCKNDSRFQELANVMHLGCVFLPRYEGRVAEFTANDHAKRPRPGDGGRARRCCQDALNVVRTASIPRITRRYAPRVCRPTALWVGDLSLPI